MQADETQTIRPTRTGFVRSLPETMPVEEVIERGREVGLTIQPSDVHSTRYYMRQEALAMASAVPAPASRMPPPVRLQPPVAEHAREREPVKVEPEPSPSGRRAGRKRVNQVALRAAPPPMGAWKEQLRVMVVRMGSDRVRDAVAEIEDDIARKAAR
jgi:hypothetical protein